MKYLLIIVGILFTKSFIVKALSLQNLFNGTLNAYINRTSFTNWTSADISCKNKCKAVQLLCFCDVDCVKYGDCCYDYWNYCSNLNVTTTETLSNMSINIRNTQDQYKTYIKMGFLNNPKYSYVVDGSKVCYFPRYNIKVISKCDPMYPNATNYTTNENLCLGKNISSAQLNASEVTQAYYDTNTSLIYKNYYCAKCNGIADNRIAKVDKFVTCKAPAFDAFVDGEKEITIENMYRYCNMSYLPPNQSAKYRSSDSFKENFLTYNQNLSSEIMDNVTNIFILNGDSNSPNTYIQLQSGLCDIYMMPINLSIAYQGAEILNNLFFKNIHCFQCWMSTNSFSLDFLNNAYSNISGIYSTIGNYNISLKYFESTVYQNMLNDVNNNYKCVSDYLKYEDISNIYSFVNRVKSNLIATDDTFVVKNVSKILKRIDPRFRSGILSSISAYTSSLLESDANLPNVTSSYEFILNVTIVLSNYYLNSINMSTSQQIVDLIKTNVTKELIKRFNLSALIYNGPLYAIIEVPNENAKYANISMNLRFNVKNIALLNMKMNSIFLVLRHLSIYREFFLSGYNLNIDRVILYKNTSNTKNFKQFKYKYDLLPYFYIDEKAKDTVFYSSVEFTRMNAVKIFMPYNTNDETYLKSYHIEMLLSSYGSLVNLNIQYDPSLESDIKSTYNSEIDGCNLDLYALNNSVRLASQVNNELSIVYNFSDRPYNFKLSNIIPLSDNIYLICVNGSTDSGRNLSNLLDELISIKDGFANKTNKIFGHRYVVLVVIFLLIYLCYDCELFMIN